MSIAPIAVSGAASARRWKVAATLGVKLGTVRSRIHRGRAQLRRALEHRDPVRRRDPVGDLAADLGT